MDMGKSEAKFRELVPVIKYVAGQASINAGKGQPYRQTGFRLSTFGEQMFKAWLSEKERGRAVKRCECFRNEEGWQ